MLKLSGSSISGRILVAWLASLCGLSSLSELRADVPAGYQQFVVPGLEEQLWGIFEDNDNTPDLVEAQGMRAVISVTAAGNDTTLYYDHWENGYSFDPNSPTNTADETVVLPRGRVQQFISTNVAVRPRGTNTFYDGGDIIHVAGGPVTVTRATWPESIGTVYALAWEVYPTKPFLRDYIVPVGENLDSSLGYNDFDNVYVLVQAIENGTTVSVDDPGSPGVEIDAAVLGAGQATNLHHIDAGTIVTASAPVQVQFVVGDFAGGTGNASEMRGFTAVPRSLWSREYYSPVGGAVSANMDLYVFNPHATNITVNYEDTSGTGSFTLGPGATRAYSDTAAAGRFVPTGSGVYLSSEAVFWAIGSGDAENFSYDWGFSLVPVSALTEEYFLGWAPGANDTPPSVNGSPVYITPVEDNTTVYIEYGPATSGVADLSYTLNRLQSQKVFDPDNDNTGMRLWSTGPFAVAWGEDPDTAAAENPYLDMGYTTLPLPREWVDLVLTIDKTVEPYAVQGVPGQSVRFTLETFTYSYGTENVDVSDILPDGWAYVDDSTVITFPNGTVVSNDAANPSASGQELTWDLSATLDPGEVLTVAFTAETTAGIALGIDENVGRAVGYRFGTNEVFRTRDSAFVYVTDLGVSKTSNRGTLSPGDTNTYTIVVTNEVASGAAHFAIRADDLLPTGLTYVAGSTVVTGWTPTNTTYRDEFNAIAFDGNQGSLPWAGAWQELGESDGAGGGEVLVWEDAALSEQYVLRLGSVSAEYGASRAANLSGAVLAILSFDYRRLDLEDTDSVYIEVSTNGSPFVEVARIVGGGAQTDGAYIRVSTNISRFVSANTVIQFRTDFGGFSGDNVLLDNVQISATGFAPVTKSNAPGAPSPLLSGAPPALVTTNDAFGLAPGSAMSITFDTVVDSPLPGGVDVFTNRVFVTSDKVVSPIVRMATNPVAVASSGIIGDLVWDDINWNGIQDAGEPGVPGVVVTLYDAGSNVLNTTTTAVDGAYAFTNLAPAAYLAGFRPPAGYDFALQDRGGDDARDSDADPSTGITAPLVLSPGADLLTVDAGLMNFTSNLCGACFIVADDGGAGGGDDLMIRINRITGAETAVGIGTGTDNIEAIATDPFTRTVYAADSAGLGTLNPTTGVYSAIGSFGTANGSRGPWSINDVDSLSLDPFSGVLYGAERNDPTNDLLIAIDAASGSVISNFFGPGEDYVVIPAVSNLIDIDDVAIDPFDGRMYAIANSGGVDDRLVRIDKATGAATDVGALGVGDMEGLGFDNSGRLFGTTGTGDALYDIDKTTGAASNPRPLSIGDDYESFDCLTCDPNLITGTVFHDANEDGVLNGLDVGQPGAVVRLYRDVNTNGVVDAADVLLDTRTTDANGEYAFLVAAMGAFVLDSDTGTLPGGAFLTTDNLEDADFGMARGLTDAGNDFGFALRAGLVLTKTAGNAADGDVEYVLSGSSVIYRYEVVNTGTTYLADIVVTDNVEGVIGTIAGPVAPGATNVLSTTNASVVATVTNTAVADGNPSESNGTDIAVLGNVNDSDDAVVVVVNPGIRITKLAGSAPDGTTNLVRSGSDVLYTYEVVNVGDTHLDNVTVTDSVEGVIGTLPGRMPPGATNTLTATRSNVTADVTNVGVVTGNPTDGSGADLPDIPDVSDSDDAITDVINPAVAIDKTVSLDGSCPGVQSVRGVAGATVTYCMIVRNTGDVPLDDVTVTDTNITPNVSTNLGTLAVGGVATIRVDTTISGDLTNTASVVGDDPNDDPVGDDDDAVVDEIGPAIAIDKTVSLDGSCPGVQSVQGVAGAMVTYCMIVRNTGDVPLDDVTVTDTNITPNVATNLGTLAVGGVATIRVDTSISGDLTNTASVVGDDPNDDPVGDDDDAVVDQIRPAVQLIKTADSAPDGTTNIVVSGSDVVYTYEVVNVGDTYLSDLVVTDDVLLVVGTLPGPLAPGETNRLTAIHSNVTAGVTNVGVVVANPTDSGGTNLPFVADVTDRDDAVTVIGAALGDRVWLDVDANGVQDAAESGVSNVTVNLYDAGSNLVATTTTDTNGLYRFERLVPGDYTVEVVPPAGHRFGPRDAGSDDGTDSDIDPATGRALPVSLGVGQVELTVDAGLYQPASLGNRVWTDLDLDGIQESGEPGMPGILLSLYHTNGTVVATAGTLPDGSYAFTGLPPGTYRVGVSQPPGLVFTPANQGADDALDSDTDQVTGLTPWVTLVSGDSIDTIDAGLLLAQPGIRVTKLAGRAPDGGVYHILPGEDVLYTYRVDNVGNTWLSNITLTDDILGSIGTIPGPLAPAASTTLTARATNVLADITNIATVVGTPVGSTGLPLPPLGTVTDDDPAVVDVVQPGYSLSKVLVAPTNRPAVIRETMEFRITVTNTGDLDFVSVPLTDVYSTNHLAFVRAQPPVDAVTNGTLLWSDVGPLPVGSTTNVSVFFTALEETGTASVNRVIAAPRTPPETPGVPPATNDVPYEITTVSIGDQVWVDLDGNGQPDEDLSVWGLNGVRVQLYTYTNGSWHLLATTNTTTDAGGRRGNYLFPGLGYGQYRVDVMVTDIPTGYNEVTTSTSIIVPLGPGQDFALADFGFRAGNPTAVTLLSLAAEAVDGVVRIRWVTAIETACRGFNIYRTDQAGPWASVSAAADRVNPRLVPGSPNGAGQAYELVDAAVRPDRRYYYWLEEVTHNGDTELFGPKSVTTQAPRDRKLAVFNVPERAAAGPCVVVVDRDELRQAGIPVETADISELKVWVGDVEVSVFASAFEGAMAKNDYILFYYERGKDAGTVAFGLGPDAKRMLPAYAEPVDDGKGVFVGQADENETVVFECGGEWSRCLLTGFRSKGVWILDVTNPLQPMFLFGYAVVQANGEVGYHLSHAPEAPAECIAVGGDFVLSLEELVAPDDNEGQQ